MRGAEGVVHVRIGQGSQRLGEGRVILLLAFVEAHVLQQHHVARLHGIDDLLGALAHNLGAEHDVAPQQLLQAARHRAQAEGLLVAFARRSATMAHEHHLGAVVQQLAQGRQRRAQARVVGDVARVIHGGVEIHAHEHALALRVQLVDAPNVSHQPIPFDSKDSEVGYRTARSPEVPEISVKARRSVPRGTRAEPGTARSGASGLRSGSFIRSSRQCERG